MVPTGCESDGGNTETIARPERSGGSVVAERVCSREETRATNDAITAAIRARAELLALHESERADLVRDDMARQGHWDWFLGNPVVSATWLLRRP